MRRLCQVSYPPERSEPSVERHGPQGRGHGRADLASLGRQHRRDQARPRGCATATPGVDALRRRGHRDLPLGVGHAPIRWVQGRAPRVAAARAPGRAVQRADGRVQLRGEPGAPAPLSTERALGVLSHAADLRRRRGGAGRRRPAHARSLARLRGRRGGDRTHEPVRRLGYNRAMTTARSKTLEIVPNPHPDRDYEVTMTVPEFTCLCPRTGQPDFATIRIRYVPDQHLVELKSLKLYLWSYRQEGAFHEDVTNRILNDFVAVARPRWLEVMGDFNVRGGIKTEIRATHGKRPEI